MVDELVLESSVERVEDEYLSVYRASCQIETVVGEADVLDFVALYVPDFECPVLISLGVVESEVDQLAALLGQGVAHAENAATPVVLRTDVAGLLGGQVQFALAAQTDLLAQVPYPDVAVGGGGEELVVAGVEGDAVDVCGVGGEDLDDLVLVDGPVVDLV